MTKELEETLHSSMKNKELFELMDINKSLVYFSTALNADRVVLFKLTRLEEYKKYEADLDLLEDTQVEINQAIEMCTIYREIISGMTDAFASVISNNVNNVMRILAVITIVLSVPTLIASVFGMNFKNMPLTDNDVGFWIIIGASIVLALVAACILVFTSKKGRGRKK
jgi:magnesium transporter